MSNVYNKQGTYNSTIVHIDFTPIFSTGHEPQLPFHCDLKCQNFWIILLFKHALHIFAKSIGSSNLMSINC